MSSTESELRGTANSAAYRNNLNRKLYEAALEGVDTDVMLVFGKFEDSEAPKVHVHSSILKTESSVFKVWMSAECWNSEFIKSSDGKIMISLPADDPEDFRAFLQFLYGQTESIEKAQLHKLSIPAFRMADKFGALNVMKVCQDESFPMIVKDMKCENYEDDLLLSEVMALAHKYDVTCLFNVGLENIKRMPRILLSDHWANKIGETVLTRILSMDRYKYGNHDLTWSDSETLLCHLAVSWLCRRKELVQEDIDEAGDSPPSKRIRVGEAPVAVRVLQNIRFRQMTSRDLERHLPRLTELLTPHQIEAIALVRAGVPQDEITTREGEECQFVVNTKIRHESD